MRWTGLFRRNLCAGSPSFQTYLRRHTDEILIAGGCRESPVSPFVGGMWVMEVCRRERAVELIEQDPYWVPEHRTVRLLTWGKGLEDRVVVL